MRRFGFLLSSVILMAAAHAFATDDVVARAMKLYEKRHYHEAARSLRAEGASIEQGKKGSASLVLGMIYFKNAVLHRELHQAAVAASQDYLKKLLAAQDKDRSRFVDLYFGEALAESGKPGAAANHLKRFSQGNGVEPRYRAIAQVCLGLGYYRNNEPSKGTELWRGIDASDLEVKAELASAYSKAGLKEKDPSVMAESILSEIKRSSNPLSMRVMKNLIAIYARGSGSVEKGLDLLERSDLRAFSYREVLGKSKVIHFYDLSLLNDMATLYGRASMGCLEKAATDPKVKDAAEFYLGQAYALFGSVEQSSKVIASFVATSQMPQQYKDRFRVWQGVNLYARNRQTEAMGWSLMPTFVGLQAPCDSFSGKINAKRAAAQGTAAANQAIADAQAYGLGPGSPVYYDMEAYDHTKSACRTAVLTFLDAWTRQLRAGGYVSGVYSSADAAIIDLQSTATIAGHSLAEPQAIWFALWDNASNLTGAPYVTSSVWPVNSRSKQYAGGHMVKVGGISLDIDAD